MKRFCVLALLILMASTVVYGQELMEKADHLYDKRGEQYDPQTFIADSTNIDGAIEILEKIVAEESGAVKEEALWKLLRALYFKGYYTTGDSELKKKIYDDGKNIGEAALKEFPQSAGINLFLAIIWGVWSEEYGILNAAKKGVAGKVRSLCEKSIEIDPTFDDAGAYRVLGRVYFKSPKIPIILGWPSKEKAITYLEKSLLIAPDDLATKQFLGEALYAVGKKERAIELMKEILAVEEVQEGVVEDKFYKRTVKETLAEWGVSE
ncbi:hypothetical protein JXB12_06465 [candidate division KSB1 bacterium]|nr:hypothetical protein [candidate division KSB1 bacterium]